MRDESLNRRDFLITAGKGGAALVLVIHFPAADREWLPAGAAAGSPAPTDGSGTASEAFSPAAWLRIDPDGTVSVVVDEAELGQGVTTTLPMIVAEELDADWSQVRPLPIPANPAGWVRDISTGGSTSTRMAWEPLRKAGATAREMLKRAAAAQWSVMPDQVRTENGFVVNTKDGRRLGYGALVEHARGMPVPTDPPLKDPRDFRIVGQGKPRLDVATKVDGSAVFGLDIALPGMLVATVARPPAFGATLRRHDDAAARRVPGVVDVVQVPQGVAVVARSTWAALKGRAALSLDWDTSPATGLSSDALFSDFEALADSPGTVAREAGDPDGALASAARVVEADYALPFIDHAPMEPLNAVAHVRDGGVEVWVPTQVATASQQTAARVAGVPVANVVMHVPFIGGGFGRRLETDDVELAVEVAKRVDGPVQVLWTREDSIRNGAYRPLTYHRLRGGLDPRGEPVAWTHRVVGAGPRGLVVPGLESPPYRLPNFRGDFHIRDTAIPTGAWRSVTYTHFGFVIESFIDELAHAAGKDPYRFRRDLMTEPRLRDALDLAASRAGWGKATAGRTLGIAAVSSFRSHVAEVAEISVEDGQVRVHRVVCAVHCGQVVNPGPLREQVEGAITLALGFTLKHQITVRDGAVEQGNFTDYPVLRIDEMPEVEVHVVPSADPPTGIGEPPVPPLAAAVANAIFAATARRPRRLPIEA